MFTSEPSLAQRIARMIGDQPIIDTRSHLDHQALGAASLADLLAAPPLARVLAGVGMPTPASDPTRSEEERVVATLPYLRLVRTTAAGWCFFRILRDLYDFDEPQLTLANYPALQDQVAHSAADRAWASQILTVRSRIEILVTPVLELDPERVVEPPTFVRHYLPIVGVDQTDEATPEQIRVGIFAQLDAVLDGSVRFTGFATVPDPNNPIHAAVLQWHDLHAYPIQVVLDPTHESSSISAVTQVVARYPRVRFGLMTGAAELGASLARLAGQFPTILAEGFAGEEVCPAVIEANVLSRIQQAGITKISGFASGATSTEWVYGTLQAVKKATAAALAQAVSNGFFEEDELPPLLRSLFFEAPAAWYRLLE